MPNVRSIKQPWTLRPEMGMTLVELMVAMTLGLIITGTLALIFVNSSRARSEIEKTSQQIENGRYATQALLEDVRLAGYYGEFSPSGLATPAAVPDPSLTDAASLKAAIMLPVQGYDNGSGMPTGMSTLLADIRAGTDVLVIRRASSCVAGAAGCDAVDTTRNTYFQTTLCNNQLTVLPVAGQFLIGTSPGEFYTTNAAIVNVPTYLAKKDCLNAAALHTYYTRVYFVANNNKASDGIPTLKMAELGAGAFSIVPLVEGIEQLQVEYGLDTDNDGNPDSYSAAPATSVQWRQVTAMKLHLLARNTQTTAGFTDSRNYVLGLKSDGTDNSFGPYGDSYKRHAYTTVVRLFNVAGRLE